ncbi:spore coat protein [Bacillus cereus]|uniref:Spore coat protein n=1 Tax=Bacillus cereus TaxID=1396 RepID=A0A9W7PYR3_BACCE|nr:spore coat protein [Bacillus cereus]KAA6448173.1 spore coat protein [Bacillus cereus]KAB2398072.1 spore coat protein [Bacillus cereus]KAB2504883.1 spore coat protein [Bacillus cereus]
MSDLNKLTSFKFDKNQSNIILDLLLDNILKKHSINEEKLKNLSPEKKQQIKKLVAEIQSQVNNLLD